jgi:hypothetical protein
LSSSALADASTLAVAVFVVTVAAEHGLESRLSPVTHMISEYANTGWGGLMVAGFVAWGFSFAGTALLGSRYWGHAGIRWSDRVLIGCFWLAAAGALVTASFSTQTSEGVLPAGVKFTLRGRLHDLGSGAITLGIFGAALAALVVIDWSVAFRRWTVGVIVFVIATDAGLLAVGSSVGGLRQRLLVAAGCAWQLSIIMVFR